MDIRDLPRRHHTHAAHGSTASQPAAATSDVSSAQSQDGSTATDEATTQHVSGGGRFMHFLQAFEDKHPEEAKRILTGIADKLRADAEHAGPWSERLERWADKVQKAADTGDMSNLLPTWQPHAHFGVRAYQKAQAAPEADGLEQVAAAASSTEAAAAGSSSEDVAPVTAASVEPAAAGSSADATRPIIPGTPS